MCMEDLLIGMATESYQSEGSVSTTVSQVLESDPNRRSIVFTTDTAGVRIGINREHLEHGHGLKLSQYLVPMTLTVEKHGTCVQKAWFGVVGAGTAEIESLCGRFNMELFLKLKREHANV